MVRYRVKADRAEEQRGARARASTRSWRRRVRRTALRDFKLEDGVSFVHIASVEGPNPLQELAAFQRFQEGIGSRCDEAPVTAQLEEVGSYAMFGG